MRPGPVLLGLARRGVSDDDIVELCAETLERLGDASGETIDLAVPVPGGAERYLAQVDSRHFLGTTNWVGRRLPHHCTAVGKVLMAFGAAPVPKRALEPVTADTVTDPAVLARQLETVRARGFATAVGELEPGLVALAAPVFGAAALPLAAISISGPALRLHPRAGGRAGDTVDRRDDSAVGAAWAAAGQGGSGMTNEEILQGLFDNTLVGNAPAVKDLTNEGLAQGMGPETLLYDALIPSLEEVGARFERGDFFVPEMLIAARAMQGALDILRPLLAETGAKPIGTFVMGTVKGDVHDIGKNLVNIMLEGAGFTVHDLGVNVAPEKFVEQVQEHEPDIVGFSAFLTTTMPMFKANINALEKSGLRDKVIVMVGGAPVTQAYADAVGADGYAADASTAVRLAKSLIENRRQATATA